MADYAITPHGQTQKALDAFERGMAATQTAGPDTLLAAGSPIALFRLGRHKEAGTRLAAVRKQVGEHKRLMAS